MNVYTVTLWDTFHKWYYESSIEAKDINEATKKAYKEFQDKTTRVKGVHYSHAA